MLSKELSLLAATSFPLLLEQLPCPARDQGRRSRSWSSTAGGWDGYSSVCPQAGRELRLPMECWGGSSGAGGALQGSALREPHGAICPVQKSASCGVCGCKSLPDSCSNSSLLSRGQEGALAAGPSSLSQREGTEGTFSVKFPLPPLHGSVPLACPNRATSLGSERNRNWMGGFYESRHLSPHPASQICQAQTSVAMSLAPKVPGQ